MVLAFVVLVVTVAFGVSGREGTLSGPRVLVLWPSVACLCLSLTYRFYYNQPVYTAYSGLG